MNFKDTYKELDSLIKRCRGYGYDSLCLRYKIAREGQARYEAHNVYSDLEQSMKAAKRDELKFYQLLDELIGEHD
jgi:hypothetical protein